MSSAANDNRGYLEEEFQRRMHDAEASPSPDLWARIDHDLTIQENKHYKDRMVLYRQLAAACFVLFMLAGALLTYHYKTEANIEAGIAAIQLNNEADVAATDMAVVEGNTVKPAPAEVLTREQSIATTGTPQAVTHSNRAMAQPNAMPGKSIETAERTSLALTMPEVSDEGALQNLTSEPGAAQYNAGILSAVQGITDRKSLLGSTDLSMDATENNASSRFNVNSTFFKTARQAIMAVPSSFQSSIAMEAANNPRSLVEVSKDGLAKKEESMKKAEELALALNAAPENDKEKNETKQDGRWSVGVGYAPSFFNQNIQMPQQMMGTVSRYSLVAGGPTTSNSTTVNMNQARDEFEAETDPAFSYAAEVKAGFNIFKKIKLLAGIGFTQNTARTKSSYVINQFLFKPGTNERVKMPATTVFLPALNNNFTTDSISVAKSDDFYVNYRYRHITLPVGLQFENNIGKDWFWYTAGGMAANFLVETTVMSNNNEVAEVNYGFNDDSPFRKVQFSGNVSAGMGKRISNGLSITAGPEFRGYLNSLLSEPDKALAPQGNPYTIGFNMSVNYNLGQK